MLQHWHPWCPAIWVGLCVRMEWDVCLCGGRLVGVITIHHSMPPSPSARLDGRSGAYGLDRTGIHISFDRPDTSSSHCVHNRRKRVRVLFLLQGKGGRGKGRKDIRKRKKKQWEIARTDHLVLHM